MCIVRYIYYVCVCIYVCVCVYSEEKYFVYHVIAHMSHLSGTRMYGNVYIKGDILYIPVINHELVLISSKHTLTKSGLRFVCVIIGSVFSHRNLFFT